jgi:CRP-like cAMP-binding protein
VSRLDLSKMVGASREMVSRVMSDLEARRVIQTREDGSILIGQIPG